MVRGLVSVAVFSILPLIVSLNTILWAIEEIDDRGSPAMDQNPIDVGVQCSAPFAVHCGKISIHLRQSSVNKTNIHSFARSGNHLRETYSLSLVSLLLIRACTSGLEMSVLIAAFSALIACLTMLRNGL